MIKYELNLQLELCRRRLFSSLDISTGENIFHVLELSSGDFLPKSKLEDGKYKVFGGGGFTETYHNSFNIKKMTIGIGRVGARCGCVFIVDEKSWITDNALYAKRIDPKYDIIFLKHYLNYLQLNQYANQMAQPVISKKKIKHLKIPLLNYEKQEEIGHALDLVENYEIDEVSFRKLGLVKPINISKKISFLNDEFNDFYDGKYSIINLRQSILQEAVHGKLIPQDPNDEPASELLKKIKAEKEKLIKEGKIKKQKPLPPISEDDLPCRQAGIPDELPKGWEWCRLGEIGYTQTGSTPPKNNPYYYGNDYPFIKPGDLSENGVNYNNEGLSFKGIEKGRFIEKGSVLMVCIGGSIGKTQIIDRDCSCNQQINTINVYKPLINMMIYYILKSEFFQNIVVNTAGQTTLPIISKGKWDIIPVPVPPVKEQKRIVEKVDKLMKLCDELEKNIEQSKKDSELLMKAVLQEAFGVSN